MSEYSQYIVSFSKLLFSYLNIEGVTVDDASDYLTQKIEEMLACSPNLPKDNKIHLPTGIKRTSNAWVLRDYYPGTRVMFKVTITETKNNSMLYGLNSAYLVKTYYVPPMKLDKRFTVGSTALRARSLDKAFEKSVFGETSKTSGIISIHFPRTRRMAPKGMVLLPLKRNKGSTK
jgi:hypothetical protein